MIQMIKVGFMRLTDDAMLPVKAHPTDSGFDLFANESVIIGPGETVVIKTGIAVQLPPGYEAQVRPRSGVTSKTKLRVQLGTVDNGYTGEIGIIVDNIFNLNYAKVDSHFLLIDNGEINIENAREKYKGSYLPGRNYTIRGTYLIRKGDKLAQLVIQKLPQVDDYEIDKLQDSTRGTNGFGSSGY